MIVCNAVQKGLGSWRHRKDLRAKRDFSSQSIRDFLSDGNISIVKTLDVDINAN